MTDPNSRAEPTEYDLNCAENVAYCKQFGPDPKHGEMRVDTFNADRAGEIIARHREATEAEATHQLREDLAAGLLRESKLHADLQAERRYSGALKEALEGMVRLTRKHCFEDDSPENYAVEVLVKSAADYAENQEGK